jgi:PAS domain S-box-containing protein
VRCERVKNTSKSILQTVPDAMVVIDENGVMQSFSTAAERLRIP